jgi:hypothetical protein
LAAPATHVLIGLAILVVGAAPARLLRWQHGIIASILALGPDVLLLLALALGMGGYVAERASHSLLLAGLLAIVLRLWLGRVSGDSCGHGREGVRGLPTATINRTVGLGAAIWMSHTVLDCLSSDLAAPPGVAVLWPAWDKPLQLAAWFPVKVVETDNLEAFLHSVLSGPFLRQSAWESLVVVPLLVVAWLWRSRHKRDNRIR